MGSYKNVKGVRGRPKDKRFDVIKGAMMIAGLLMKVGKSCQVEI